MKQFVVIGNPITHSRSPEIHAAFAAQFSIALKYERLQAEKTQFAPVAARFFEHGGTGANVTVPFKEDALRFADELSEVAKLSGAVNTLSKQHGTIKGDNTDGMGLVRDIRDNHGVSFRDKKVLIIGAGGAARGVMLPIAQETPHAITIVNRTAEKARQLAKVFADYASTHAAIFEELSQPSQPFDIVINATSASLLGEKLTLNPNIFTADTLAYDMMYGAQPTAFMQSATASGATAVDGLGMLVEQAAKSFEIWNGVQPETQAVIKAIRQQIETNP